MSSSDITLEQAIALHRLKKITVIDVREAAELADTGTAKDGVHVALALVAMRADRTSPDHDARIDPSKPVCVFCAKGGRAGQAVTALRGLGYEAHNIGGFADWAAAGGPVSR
jgi:rhodanese-related sulfurtransferase